MVYSRELVELQAQTLILHVPTPFCSYNLRMHEINRKSMERCLLSI